MKTKVIYLGVAAVMLLGAVLFSAIDSSEGTFRYQQHLEQPGEAELEPCKVCNGKSRLCTHLPIIEIDTHGKRIPFVDLDGTPLDGLPAGAPLEVFCSVDIKSKSNTWNMEEDKADLSADALIRIRGNSSRFFRKKPYRLKFVTPSGEDAEQSVMGMAPGSEWVLNGPFLDRTMIRNYLCYSVAGQVMEYAPDVRFCEMILNGEYRGIYLMTEAIAKGEERVNLTAPERGKAMTSWMIRWDRTAKADILLNNYTFYTYQSGVSGVDLRYPGKNTVTPERIDYVEAEFSQIERSIYTSDFKDPVKGYSAYLDTKSFAQYFVLNEFFGNVDAGRFSTYYYKDVRGKVFPVVWDFNNACDNYIADVYDDAGFNLIQSPWFGQLMRDERFVDEVVRQYRSLRKTVLSDEYLTGFIDDTIAYLGSAVHRNYEAYGYVFEPEEMDDVINYLYPASRNYQSYDESVEQLKGWLTARGAWMDKYVDTLYQHCRESKNATRILE